jgi:hypothetical protein
MSKRADEHIPADILRAAERAGLDAPLWYVGRSNGHETKRLKFGLGKVVEDAYRKAGKQPPPNG